jgi:hypothetical protein
MHRTARAAQLVRAAGADLTTRLRNIAVIPLSVDVPIAEFGRRLS